MYAIWRACERFNIKPPEMTTLVWEDMSEWEQALLLSYDQIRTKDQAETLLPLMGL